MTKERRLGRGLEALLGRPPEEYASDADVVSGNFAAHESGGAVEVNVYEVDSNPFQPRVEFGEEELASLAESIKHHVREEESKVFSIAREAFDQEQLDELGDLWMKTKKRMETPAIKGVTRAANATKTAASRSRR